MVWSHDGMTSWCHLTSLGETTDKEGRQRSGVFIWLNTFYSMYSFIMLKMYCIDIYA